MSIALTSLVSIGPPSFPTCSLTLVSFQPMRRAVHHWQARSISRLRQPIHIAADLHVRLEGPAVQLIPEMLAQRRLANLRLSGYLGLGDTKGRSTLHKRALGIGRHIFGWRS
jgi:hypothetical protein